MIRGDVFRQSGASCGYRGLSVASEGRDRYVFAIYAEQAQEAEMLSIFMLLKHRGPKSRRYSR